MLKKLFHLTSASWKMKIDDNSSLNYAPSGQIIRTLLIDYLLASWKTDFVYIWQYLLSFLLSNIIFIFWPLMSTTILTFLRW